MLKGMKIRGKLMLMVIPLAVFMLIVMTVYTIMVNMVSNRGKELYYDQLYTANSSLINADRDFYQAYTALLEYIVDGSDASKGEAYVTDFKENLAQTQERVEEVEKIVLKYKELGAFSQNGINMDGEFQKFETNIAALNQIANGNLGQEMLAEFDQVFQNTRDNISNMEDTIDAYAVSSETKLQKSISGAVAAIVVVVLLVFAAIAVFCVFLIRYIRISISQVSEELSQIAEKDLTVEVKVIEGKDEIAQLSQATHKLRDQFFSVVRTLQESSNTLESSSSRMAENTRESVSTIQDINESAQELASTATQQAMDVANIANDVMQMDDMSKENRKDAEELANACGDIEQITKSGMDTVTELTKVTEKTMEAFDRIFYVIKGIESKTKNIGMASDMISDIANQTNLLSLNASIEAARAGEAGRGFSVVADEIRQLAEQSASSANTINKMLSELVTSADEAAYESGQVKDYVEKQRQSVEDTRDSFASIVNNMAIVNDGVSNIDSVSMGLGEKVEEISKLIESLTAQSQENAATAEELSSTTTVVTSSIEELRMAGDAVGVSSEELNAIVSEFQV